MKTLNYLLIILGLFACISCINENVPDREIYQIKVYSFDTEEQVLATDKYLKEAYLPGLKRIGIQDVGVLKSRLNENDSIRKTFVIIPFSSLDQFYSLEDELAKDEIYLTAGGEYIDAPHDNTPYNRIESTLLKAFENMPFMEAPDFEGDRSDRVYELRSYQSATEAYHISKVDMFNAGGEIKLFEKLEFNAVFYAQVISGSQMPNLMYMITFTDEESRKAHWSAFVNSPEWSELKVMSKYANTVSHIDKYLLYPTEYSNY